MAAISARSSVNVAADTDVEGGIWRVLASVQDFPAFNRTPRSVHSLPRIPVFAGRYESFRCRYNSWIGAVEKDGRKPIRHRPVSFAEKLAETFEPVEESHAVEAPSAVGESMRCWRRRLSEMSFDGEERRRMVKYGEDLLDKLDDIRHGLLLGSIPKDKLIALAQMVRSRRGQVTDPRLSAVLDEIELRAEVELAKL